MHSGKLPLALLVTLAALCLPAGAGAQSRMPVELSRLRVGLPAGPLSGDEDRLDGGFQNVFKAGVFAPVFVDVAAFDSFSEPLELVVETADADNALTVMSVPLPPLQKGDRRGGYELPRLPYLKTASYYPEVTAYVRTAGRQRVVSNTLKRSFNSRDANDYLIVAVGNSPAGFRLKAPAAPRPGEAVDLNNPELRRHRGGAVELAQCVEVGQLPDHWLGYAAFDLMLISTGELEKFWTDLKAAPGKQRAITEWVARGGRVLISVGTNLDLVNDLPLFRELLPAALPPGGKKQVAGVPLNWFSVKGNLTQNSELRDPAGVGTVATVEIAPRPGRPFRRLVPPESNKQETRPVVVQAAYGLGKVTLVNFDLDRAPFADWKDRDGFWEYLVTEAGARLPESEERLKMSDRDDPQFTLMNDMLDSFEGVPVISFGWVALFILVYILLIGPVDYFFLKRVLKRLEWTWVTFPLMVLLVSGLAYYAAYALKGSEQKINKIDFVDVDLQTQRLYGQTYFTLFSPRIQNYQIGLEPAGPLPGSTQAYWTAETAEQTAGSTVVSWNSQLREQGRSLLQRRYEYRNDLTDPDRPLVAGGLRDVPIQVWSTKSFAAQWSAAVDPRNPLLTHTLRHPPGEPDKLTGAVVSNLPVPVPSEVRLFYRDRSINLGALTPGVEKTVTFKETSEPITNALGPLNAREFGVQPAPGQGRQADSFGVYRLYGLLFGDRLGSADRPLANTAVRPLDQSWRVRESGGDHAVLVLRLPSTRASAEAQSNDPASPSRLWLNELPGGGAARTPINGTLRQETYVRFFIPIPRAEK